MRELEFKCYSPRCQFLKFASNKLLCLSVRPSICRQPAGLEVTGVPMGAAGGCLASPIPGVTCTSFRLQLFNNYNKRLQLGTYSTPKIHATN